METVEPILKRIINLIIDSSKKAATLRTLVNDSVLAESDIIQFLINETNNDCAYILESFLSVDQLSKKRPISVLSGSGWTDAELDYYNVVFEDVCPNDIVNTNVSLSDKAAKFVENNKDFTLATLANKKGIEQMIAVSTEFQRCIVLVLNNPSMESCVDNMFYKFMENIMDTNKFLITQRYDMDLYISNIKRKAIADIVAIFFSQMYVGVIVVEDKPRDTSKTSTQWDNAEAQLLAEAIAIAQQDRWPEEAPIFMFRVLEVYVSVYKVIFSKEFLTSVRNGTRRSKPFNVLRYSPKDLVFSGNIPGCNLLNPIERDLLTKMLYSMSIEIEKCFL